MKQTSRIIIQYNFCFFVGRASFAQERIVLDEQIRFSSADNNNIYAIPLLYRISSSTNHLSITRFHQAFQAVIMKHSILRTALYLDTNGVIMQHCLDARAVMNVMNSNSFSILNMDDHDIYEIINKISSDSHLFDLSKGHVICCHILQQYHPNNDLSVKNDDLLINDDMILISIHHSVFDGASTSIFLRDLCLAYDNDCSLPIADNILQYLDYSVHERLMDMTLSRDFWHSQLEEYNLEQSLSLSVDRHCLSGDQRSGLASVAKISFHQKISTSFLNYASSHQLTPFQLGLAAFYAFLFKLTHGQADLCIASVNANRYRSELQDMIGMFVATLPYRLQLDSSWSFDELVEHVREKCMSILGHSHYPLQHILADLQVNQSNAPFLQTMFDFITASSDVNELSLNGTSLEEVSMEQLSEVAKFDFSLTFVHNPTSDGLLSCSFVCSHDLFEETTVARIAQRFQYLLEQLFSTNVDTVPMGQCFPSINKLSLILPEEAEEMQTVIFDRLPKTVHEGM